VASRLAQQFVDDFRVGALAATRGVGEPNFRSPQGGGDAAMLEADPRFDTRVRRDGRADGETVSSTHIRGLILAGEVDQAARFLGEPFQMRGQVAHGDKRGRELGFPTANVVPDDALAYRGHGVYAALAGIDGEDATRPAAVNVGVRPTFETGRGLLVEAYLLDFDATSTTPSCGSTSSSGCAREGLPLGGVARRADAPRCGAGAAHQRTRREAPDAPDPGERATLPGAGMTLTQERKREITAQYGRDADDTGRTEVQVAMLTERSTP